MRRHGAFPRPAHHGITRHPCARVHGIELLLGDDPDRPEQLLFAEPTAEVRAHSVAGVGENRAESNALLFEPAHLVEGDTPLRSERDVVGHIDLRASVYIVGPRLGQVEAQSDGQRHVVIRERRRHQALAVGLFPQRAAVLMRDTDRLNALLRQRRVVDDQERLFAAKHGVGLLPEHPLDSQPDPRRLADEVPQLLVVTRRHTSGERLDALALARQE